MNYLRQNKGLPFLSEPYKKFTLKNYTYPFYAIENYSFPLLPSVLIFRCLCATVVIYPLYGGEVMMKKISLLATDRACLSPRHTLPPRSQPAVFSLSAMMPDTLHPPPPCSRGQQRDTMRRSHTEPCFLAPAPNNSSLQESRSSDAGRGTSFGRAT